MDKREALKSMLNALINDNQEQAALDLHGYLAAKMQDVAGLTQQAPEDASETVDEITQD